jgi:hydroxymethylbilane synthase
VHAAVHSLKDLPTEESPGLTIGAIPARVDVRDVLVCPAGLTLEELPAGSIVGTSSTRRRALLLAYRPDLRIEPMRGNVDTRIRKALDGQYDAIVLAAAGVIRLGLEEQISQYLPVEVMPPAPGQGALAVQCRIDDEQTLTLLSAIEHPATRQAVTAERAFLTALGGGCSLPVGASATTAGGRIELHGVIAAPDGSRVVRLSGRGGEPERLGQRLAQQAFEQGAGAYLPQDALENRS